jgi:hypothetical protein
MDRLLDFFQLRPLVESLITGAMPSTGDRHFRYYPLTGHIAHMSQTTRMDRTSPQGSRSDPLHIGRGQNRVSSRVLNYFVGTVRLARP